MRGKFEAATVRKTKDGLEVKVSWKQGNRWWEFEESADWTVRFSPAGKLSSIQNLGFPAIAPSLLAAIWLPIFASFALAIWTGHGPTREALTETRELYIALSILAYALLLVSYANRGSVDTASPGPGIQPDGS